ncbi:DUF3024 domain-containing protein [Galactobacter valiniphilus]|uniref:DUF3024 domain-containing protein n=1 Tax=Galactobacter valiniphilus TaxID=2676122 RepID=UPI003735A181
MAIREQDLEVIHAWAASHVPVEVADRAHVHAVVDGHRVTIFEGHRRTPESQWQDTPVARLRFTAVSDLWSLWWPDQNREFHAYEPCAPAERVSTILAAIDADEHSLFWG